MYCVRRKWQATGGACLVADLPFKVVMGLTLHPGSYDVVLS